MNIIDEFKEISIRGRVAYVTCCLQNVLDIDKYDNEVINLILDKAWRFVEDDIIDSYHCFLEVIPECILDPKADFLEFETIEIDVYQKLNYLVKQWPNDINLIIDELSYLMSSDLYSTTGDHSADTLFHLKKIVSIMKKNNWLLPDISLFYHSRFEDGGGWGEPTSRNKFFTSNDDV